MNWWQRLLARLFRIDYIFYDTGGLDYVVERVRWFANEPYYKCRTYWRPVGNLTRCKPLTPRLMIWASVQREAENG